MMRWKCPHCSTGLAIEDEKASDNWHFSKCYQCEGFALVKRSQVSVVKVEKGPGQEHANAIQSIPEPIQQPIQLQEKPREIPREVPRENLASIPITAVPHVTPEKMPPFKPAPAKRSRVIPVGMGLVASIAVLSGFYLYQQGQELIKRTRQAREMTESSLDRIPQMAMAPERMPEKLSDPSDSQKTEITVINKDAGKDSANAPAIEPKPITVQIKSAYANLRGGPGTEFPIVSTAEPGTIYLIKGWEGRWFKIVPEDPSQAALQKKNMWVRNDLVDTLRTE